MPKKLKTNPWLVALIGLGSLGILVGGGFAISRAIGNIGGEASSASSSEKASSSGITSSSSVSEITSNPTISVNKSKIDLYATVDVTDPLPYGTFQAVIQNLPSSATSETSKKMYMYSDDTISDWFEVYIYDSGNKTALSYPYTFTSGTTIYFQLLKGVSTTTESYKIPIWIYSAAYEPSQVYGLVEFYIYPDK